MIAAGGLHIIGTERHESRRIDNQLRGRSGRQGDPGSSRFYLSLEDNLMRIFGDPTRMKALMTRVGMKAGEAIESGMLTRQIERAQRRVEQHNFDARKQLLEYDDVANDQRRVIYQQRTDLMGAEDVAEAIKGVREDVVAQLVDQYLPPGVARGAVGRGRISAQAIERDFGPALPIDEWVKAEEAGDAFGAQEPRSSTALEAAYEQKQASVGAEVMRYIEKEVMLRTLDQHWREHLAAMDYMRQGIFLRSYAQKNPKQEYKREAFELFSAHARSHQVRHRHDGVQDPSAQPGGNRARRARAPAAPRTRAAGAARGGGFADPSPGRRPEEDGEAPRAERLRRQRHRARCRAAIARAPAATPFVRAVPKVGRNEMCPCGSGKKYKHCHGALQQASG